MVIPRPIKLLLTILPLQLVAADKPDQPKDTPTSHKVLKNVRGCGYDHDMVREEVYIFESDEEAKQYIRKIASSSGAADNFEIQAADVNNASAAIIGEKRYILYNQTFMERIRNAAGTNWAGVAILAHEIGHHINGHNLDHLGSRPHKEIDADIYSGFVLAQMGASLDQAQSAMNVFPDPEVETTHPKKARRLAAIANGWKRAKDIIAKHNQNTNSPETSTGPEQRRIKKQPKRTKKTHNPIRQIAEFSHIRANWNHVIQGQHGFSIIFNLGLHNIQAKRGRVAMIFHTADGKILQDQNGAYTSANGEVMTWVDFDLVKPGGSFNDVSIHFPISELHLPAGKHNLYLELFYGEIQPDGTVGWIQKTNQIKFAVTMNQDGP